MCSPRSFYRRPTANRKARRGRSSPAPGGEAPAWGPTVGSTKAAEEEDGWPRSVNLPRLAVGACLDLLFFCPSDPTAPNKKSPPSTCHPERSRGTCSAPQLPRKGFRSVSSPAGSQDDDSVGVLTKHALNKLALMSTSLLL